jgi:hypothetical protein
MSKFKLNGIHGMFVGMGISVVIIGGAFLCASLFPMAKASPEPAFTSVKIGETSTSDIERFYDREAGVVCYIVDGFRTMGCVPVSQTNVEWRTSP